jgi:hypothetical protein
LSPHKSRMSKTEGNQLWIPCAARFIAPLAVAIVSTMLLGTAEPVRAQQTPQAPVSREVREAWRKSMLQKAPRQSGCFKVEYPKTEWEEVTCGAPAVGRFNQAGQARAKRVAEENQVGDGNDYAAQSSGANLISSAVGSFLPGVSRTDNESGVVFVLQTAHDNVFSLQMNTQNNYNADSGFNSNGGTFSTPACNGEQGCYGWQQFVFSQTQGGPPGQGQQSVPGVPNTTPAVFIEYTLFGWGSPCPSLPSWAPTQGNPPSRLWQPADLLGDCFFNGPTTYVPPQTAADIPDLEMTSTAAAGLSQVALATGTGMYLYSEPDVLSLAKAWTQVEFNVFGDCCGYEANFSGPSVLKVSTSIDNGTTQPPVCLANDGTTGETNNLSFAGFCSTAGGTSPAVIFTESLQGKPAGTTALLYDQNAGQADLVGFNKDGIEDLDIPNSDFRTTWDQIVAGDFLGNGRDVALLYDQKAGEADVVEYDSHGGSILDGQNPHFRTTWNIIVPVDYLGDGQDRALFYDHNAGEADVLTFNKQGKEVNDAENPTFGRTFDVIVAGNFLESGQAQQVLAYDRTAGVGDVYTIDSGGKLTLKASNTHWRTTWDMIIVGDFLGNGKDQVLLYDSGAGDADIVAFDTLGRESLDAQNPKFGKPWDILVAGSFMNSGRPQQVLAYNRAAGEGSVIAFNGKGIMTSETPNTGWRTTWNSILVGDFLGDGRDQILLYDLNASHADVVAFDTHGKESLDAQNPSFGTPWNILVAGNFVGN